MKKVVWEDLDNTDKFLVQRTELKTGRYKYRIRDKNTGEINSALTTLAINHSNSQEEIMLFVKRHEAAQLAVERGEIEIPEMGMVGKTICVILAVVVAIWFSNFVFSLEFGESDRKHERIVEKTSVLSTQHCKNIENEISSYIKTRSHLSRRQAFDRLIESARISLNHSSYSAEKNKNMIILNCNRKGIFLP